MIHIITLNGTLDAAFGFTCFCGFEWGETITYGNTTATQITAPGDSFYQIIEGLNPNTTYHFRSFATGGGGTGYGVDRSFTTSKDFARVRTDAATSVVDKQGTINGTLIYDAEEVCSVRFEYGSTVDYGLTTAWQPGMTTGDTFYSLLIDLGTNVIIHFRAVAKNSHGVAYGEDMIFTTLNADEAPSTAFDQSLQLIMDAV